MNSNYRHLFVISLILLFSANLYPQWSWINPRPQGNTLNDVKFFDENNGIAAGEFGTIIKTKDGGHNWSIIKSGTSAHLISLFINKNGTVWACGNSGVLMRSTDEGEHWDLIKTGTMNDLNTVYFTDENIGFCGGGKYSYDIKPGSIILRTTNGGNDWAPVTNMTDWPINSIFFADKNTGYAAGGADNKYDSRVALKTTDQGNSWTVITPTQANNGLKSVYFTDANNGYLISFMRQILTTHDGGKTWSENNLTEYPQYSAHFSSIVFTDAANGWICGGGEGWGAWLYFTKDGGSTWKGKQFWFGHYGDLRALTFVSQKKGFAVGKNGFILKTEDGGDSWQYLSNTVFDNQISGIVFDSNKMLLVQGGHYYTEDGGINWTSRYFNPDNGPFKVFYTGGIIFGFSGQRIFKSTDMGVTWEKLADINSGDSRIIYIPKEIYMADAFNGVIVGSFSSSIQGTSGGLILRTTNGWQSYTGGIGGGRDENVTADGNNFWVIGEDSFAGDYGTVLLKVPKNGSAMKEIKLGIRAYATSIYMHNNFGVIVGREGMVLKSTDGGMTWKSKDFGDDYRFWKVFFTDELNGYAAGSRNYQPVILYTYDGGENWTEEVFPTYGEITDFSITKDRYLVAMGDNGILLKKNIDSTDNNHQLAESMLRQNYPNPVNQSTIIEYRLTRDGNVELELFNILGEKILTLENTFKAAGQYRSVLRSEGLTSGIYFYRIKTPSSVETKKLIILK